MAWKGESIASFTGGSGQMAVMAELLHRHCNAAVPQVDIGTDVFAFRDDGEEVARIQVKTAAGRWNKNGRGYAARFTIPIKQLRRTDAPLLFYALAVRLDEGWGSYIIISRAKLQELWNKGCGTESSDNLHVHVRFRPNAKGSAPGSAESGPGLNAYCGEFNLTDYVNAWESLPPIKSPISIDVDAQGHGNQSAA